MFPPIFYYQKMPQKAPASEDTISKDLYIYYGSNKTISPTFARSRENSRFLAEFCTVRFRVGRAKLPTSEPTKHLLAGSFLSIIHTQTPAQPLSNALRVVFYSDLARTGCQPLFVYRFIRRLPPDFHHVTQNLKRKKAYSEREYQFLPNEIFNWDETG
jgi:hypothetical protein